MFTINEFEVAYYLYIIFRDCALLIISALGAYSVYRLIRIAEVETTKPRQQTREFNDAGRGSTNAPKEEEAIARSGTSRRHGGGSRASTIKW